jgi:hypothetical protein
MPGISLGFIIIIFLAPAFSNWRITVLFDPFLKMPLATLSPELITGILKELDDPRDVLNAGLTCRLLYDCSQINVIWAGLTRCFKYWSISDFKPSSNPCWKSEIKRRFAQRSEIDKTIDELIESSEIHLMPKFKRVMDDMGVEAKDRCLFHMHSTPDDAPDVLARRYWSRRLFGAVQRQRALPMLANVHTGEFVSLEQTLTAVDMLVIESEVADFGWVACELDKIANDFKSAFSEWKTIPTYDLVVLLATFLVEEKDFIGPRNLSVEEGKRVNRLYLPQHYFISKALTHPTHAGTDLVYTVIFSAVLERLGGSTKLFSFSNHYYVAIESELSSYLDNMVYDFFNVSHGWKSKDYLVKEESDKEQSWEVVIPKKILETLAKQANWSLRNDTFWRDQGIPMAPEARDAQPYWRILLHWLRLVSEPSAERGGYLTFNNSTDAVWDLYLIADF